MAADGEGGKRGSPMIAAILMKFSTRYTSGSLHRAEAATLRLLSAYRSLDDLHSLRAYSL